MGTGVIGLIANAGEFVLPSWFWWLVALACFSMAQFRAYVALATKARSSEDALETAKADATKRAQEATDLSELANLAREGDRLLKQMFLSGLVAAAEGKRLYTDNGGLIFATDIQEVGEEAVKWKRKVGRHLKDQHGPAAEARFWNDVGLPSDLGVLPFDADKAAMEAGVYQNMQRRIYRLHELMDRESQ